MRQLRLLKCFPQREHKSELVDQLLGEVTHLSTKTALNHSDQRLELKTQAGFNNAAPAMRETAQFQLMPVVWVFYVYTSIFNTHISTTGTKHTGGTVFGEVMITQGRQSNPLGASWQTKQPCGLEIGLEMSKTRMQTFISSQRVFTYRTQENVLIT